MVTAALGGEEKILELLSKAVTVGGAEAAEAYKNHRVILKNTPITG